MRVALVHDYIKEFGGAERVLKVLSEMYPNAPIYTAFSVKGSTAEKEFRDRDIRESWLAPILKIGNLYSPLRFLTPLIWGSMDLSEYDLVITSSSWYITRGFRVGPKTLVICYCHTPPRWLYGYETSVGFTKYWPVKVYSAIVGHFMRIYDFATAQKPKRSSKLRITNYKITAGVDYFIANSKNVQDRIKKFYRRDSIVIYPPVDTEKISAISHRPLATDKKEDYFLTVSRLVGAKGLEEIVKVFRSKSMSKYKLKVVGEAAGFSAISNQLSDVSNSNIEILGRVKDEELYELYAGAKALICLAKEEDFGLTPVEAMAAGTPVIAFNGGGYRESVIDGVTGILINDTDEKTIKSAVLHFNELIHQSGGKIEGSCKKQAKKFSKGRFVREIREFVSSIQNQV